MRKLANLGVSLKPFVVSATSRSRFSLGELSKIASLLATEGLENSFANKD